MPRDLTDLMERATALAPPEPHDPGDITRLAVRRHRRRRATLAGGVAFALAVGSAVGYGATRGDATEPEPAEGLRYGQHLTLTDAVPATTVPGFHEVVYAVRPVDDKGQTRRQVEQGLPSPAFAEYTDVDAQGRLIVMQAPAGGVDRTISAEVLADSASTRSMARAPAPPRQSGTGRSNWIPTFADDGRLLWLASWPVVQEGDPNAHVTELDGSHDQPLAIDASQVAPPEGGVPRHAWVSGDRLWFTNQEPPSKNLKAAPTEVLYSLPLDDPSQVSTVVGHVVAAAVADGTVGWVTSDGRGHLGRAGGQVRSFALPMGRGCRVDRWAGQEGDFAVTQGLLAFAEQCGTGRSRTIRPVVVDGSGRLVLRVEASVAANYALSGASFAFESFGGPTGGRVADYRVDMRTGVMALLGEEHSTSFRPVVAGRFVLWHDSDSFHVGEFAE